MLTLNLVSQELKQKIKSRHIYSLLKKMSFILIIISIIIAIILLVAKLILHNNFNKVVEQTTLITKSSKGYINDVRKINYQINSASKIQDEYVAWSYLIEIFNELTPEGITYSHIKINKADKTIRLRGHADNRDDLIKLKDGYENSEIFIDIESPIKNILQKEDINFELDMKLNLNALLETI